MSIQLKFYKSAISINKFLIFKWGHVTLLIKLDYVFTIIIEILNYD